MINTTVTELTPEESIILKKEIRRLHITGIITGLLLSVVFTLLMFIKTEKLTPEILFADILIVSGAVFITSLSLKNLHSDLNNNKKHLNHYIITEKLSYPDDDPGIGGTHLKYFLIAEEKRFPVKEQIYNNSSVNDIIIEHVAPKTNFTFGIEILKNS